MQEAEVSLRIALYYITQHLTDEDIHVSLDGAHIKTGDKVHFDIYNFLVGHNCKKISGVEDNWRGIYEVEGYKAKIIISSTSGKGDVNIITREDKHLYIESKKGHLKNHGNSEYPLMREAIGQLMTGCPMKDNIVPTVAVPYTKKSYELAQRWSQLKQIQMVGIKFMLVREDGYIEVI